MFGIGGFELFIIVLFGFLIFGPDKLPALAKTVGQAIAKFRDAQAEMTSQLKIDELMREGAAGSAKATAPERSGKPTEPVRPAGNDAPTPERVRATAPATTASAVTASEQPASEDVAPEERPLSFSERKARYERERQAQVAAEKGGA